MYSDYKCKHCGTLIENYKKEYGESFPESIECKDCGREASRVFPNLIVDVAEGKTATGYQGGKFSRRKDIVGRSNWSMDGSD